MIKNDATVNKAFYIYSITSQSDILDLSGFVVFDHTSWWPYNTTYSDLVLAESYGYHIDYTLGDNALNRSYTTYSYETGTFTLSDPYRPGYDFVNWTGTGLASPTKTVTIQAHSHGDRRYTAAWTNVWESDKGADGTAEHPYLISTPDELKLLSAHVKGGILYSGTRFKLKNDIDMTGVNFTPIGVYSTTTSPGYFRGVFNGDNHAIKNLTVNLPNSDYVGLFGYVSGAIIQNLILDSANITGGKKVGGLVGAEKSTEKCYITNCFILHTSVTGNENTGLFYGSGSSSTFSLSNYYHHGCTVNGVLKSDSASAYEVTLDTNVRIDTPFTPTRTYDGKDYYQKDKKLYLAYTGDLEGGTAVFYVNGAQLDGISFNVTEDVTITATRRFTVSFHAGAGVGRLDPVVLDEGAEYTLPDCNFTPPTGKSFIRWQVAMGGNTVEKQPGETITVTGNVTARALYGYQPGYYVVGTMNNWQLNPAYQLTKCSDDPEEYHIILPLTTTDQFKVLYTPDGISMPDNNYYPQGMGNNYGENGEIRANGNYHIRFRPNYDESSWFGNCIHVASPCTITFDAGDGTGTMTPVVVDQGSAYTLPYWSDCSFTAPEGRPFARWMVKFGDDVAYFQPGASISVSSDLTITALYRVEPGYYLVGNMNDWQLNPAYQLTNYSGACYVYTIRLPLTTTSRFKILYTPDGISMPDDNYYPQGTGNNYGQNGQITADGMYRIKFDPNGHGDGWFYNFFSVTPDTFTVTLDAGDGTGEPIVISTEGDGAWADNPNNPNGGQFFMDGTGTEKFKLPACPGSFEKTGEVFIGWTIGTADTLLQAGREIEIGNYILYAQWAKEYSITYQEVDPEIGGWAENQGSSLNPDTAAAGTIVGLYLGFYNSAYDLGYRLEKIVVTYGEETITITTQPGEQRPFWDLEQIDLSAEFTMPAADVTVSAVWTAADGYYLIGPDWNMQSLFPLQSFIDSGGFMILETTLTVGQQLKVVEVQDRVIKTWYPEGTGNAYTVDADHDGPVTICFSETPKEAGDFGLSWGELNGHASIVPVNPPEFRSHSLSLDGKIGVNFYVNTYPYKNAKMTFTITHGDCTKEQVLVYPWDATAQNPATPHKDGCYVFTCYVNSIQMAETITATFSYNINDTTRESVSDTFSVMDYFTYFDAHKDDKITGTDDPFFSDSAKDLIKALKDYGYYVQHFLQPEKGWAFAAEGTAGYTEVTVPYQNLKTEENVAGDLYSETNLYGSVKPFTKTNNTADYLETVFEKVTYSLVLDSSTTIKVFFKLNAGQNMPAVKLGTETYTPTQQADGRYVVMIENIKADDLEDVYTITLGSNNATVKVSVLSYVNSMLNEVRNNATNGAWNNNNHNASPEAWTKAALAIYTYWFYADAY